VFISVSLNKKKINYKQKYNILRRACACQSFLYAFFLAKLKKKACGKEKTFSGGQ